MIAHLWTGGDNEESCFINSISRFRIGFMCKHSEEGHRKRTYCSDDSEVQECRNQGRRG